MALDVGNETMTEESLGEQITRFEEKAEEARQRREEQAKLGDAIRDQLSELAAESLQETGANVEVTDSSANPSRFRLRPRLDRAALVAELGEQLPDGLVVSHVNDDGTLTIEWTGANRPATDRRYGAVLKAIVAEEMTTDTDGLISDVPTRQRVLELAEDLGVPRDGAGEKLDRLATLDVIDLIEGKVYPDTNFSRI